MAEQDINIRISKEIRDKISELAKEQKRPTIKAFIQDMTLFFCRNKITVDDNIDVSLRDVLDAFTKLNDKFADRIFRFLQTEEKNYFLPISQSINKIHGEINYLVSEKRENEKEIKRDEINQNSLKEFTNLSDEKNEDECRKLKIEVEKERLITKQIFDILKNDFLAKAGLYGDKFAISITKERKIEIENFLNKLGEK